MIGTLNTTIPREMKWLAVLLLIALIGGVAAFPLSYLSNSNVLIGFCLLPLTIFITGSKRNNMAYFLLFAMFITLTFIYGVRIFYFFALAFYLLWLIELFIGRLNTLTPFLIVFMSPFFIQVVTILGFPLRLLLSDGAGKMLNAAGVNVQVEGNMMVLNGATFTVDEACMGLNMLAISMLMGVFVLAFQQRNAKTTIGFGWSAIFFIAAFFLNMITNLFRIIALVYFHIPPEHSMHEVVGIVCLIVYSWIPLHFLGRWLVQKYGTPKNFTASVQVVSKSKVAFTMVIAFVVLVGGASINQTSQLTSTLSTVQYGALKPEVLNNGISKISTDDLLIYIKPISEFFTGEHTPLMCWEGSGYTFSSIATASVSGVTIYTGLLVKDGKTLYTAWWYSNGKTKTISQLDWRLRMLKGEQDFSLINVTADNKNQLMASIHGIFTTNPIVFGNLQAGAYQP